MVCNIKEVALFGDTQATVRPKFSQRLAHEMSHSEATAKSIYNCNDSTRNSSKVTKDVRCLQLRVFLKVLLHSYISKGHLAGPFKQKFLAVA